MKEEIETVTTKTITLEEEDIEKIIKDSLGIESKNVTISLYQDTVYAHQVMGAIDDTTSIKCKVIFSSNH